MMKIYIQKSQRLPLGKILLGYLTLYLWSGILIFAMFKGYFGYALGGVMITAIALFALTKKIKARSAYFKKANAANLRSYHVGGDYLQVFSPQKRVIYDKLAS